MNKVLCEALLRAVSSTEVIERIGICTNVQLALEGTLEYVYSAAEIVRLLNDLVLDACLDLGVYSGNNAFPIESFSSEVTAAQAYTSKHSLWDPATEYGRARLAVKQRIIEKLQARIQGYKS